MSTGADDICHDRTGAGQITLTAAIKTLEQIFETSVLSTPPEKAIPIFFSFTVSEIEFLIFSSNSFFV
jgi:hypothetical protein